MADYYLEMGGYFGEEFFDRVAEDEYHPGFTCKYCGEEHLRWGMTEKRWRLFSVDLNDNWALHTCNKYKP